MKPDIQAILFQQIKEQLKNETLGHLLPDILNLSQDAVYRRLRGETPLTIHEVQKLCQQFNISLDALMHLERNSALFNYTPLNSYDFSLESYLANILESVKRVQKLSDPTLILSVNNTHFFQLLNFPQLVRFRLFFWAKTHLQIDDYKDEKFKHEKTTDRAFDLGKEILWRYNQMKSIEIVDPELMRGFMRHIFYYYKAHLLENPEYALFLCDRVSMFAQHFKEQAAIGKKFIYGTEAPASGNEFELYLNETINADGTFYIESKEFEGIFIPHNVLNYLQTNDADYVRDTRKVMDKQLANSSKISVVNEKERNNYFYNFEKMISSFKKKIETDLEFGI